jgi:hypothetical protein
VHYKKEVVLIANDWGGPEEDRKKGASRRTGSVSIVHLKEKKKGKEKRVGKLTVWEKRSKTVRRIKQTESRESKESKGKESKGKEGKEEKHTLNGTADSPCSRVLLLV